MCQGGDDDDDAPDGESVRENIASSGGSGEASGDAGKEPVGNARKTPDTSSKVVKNACVA